MTIEYEQVDTDVWFHEKSGRYYVFVGFYADQGLQLGLEWDNFDSIDGAKAYLRALAKANEYVGGCCWSAPVAPTEFLQT